MVVTEGARGRDPRTPGIGCQLNNWQRELNFREPSWEKLDSALAQLVEAGFAGAEVPSWSVPDLAEPQRLRELCAKHDVTLVSLHVGGPLHSAAEYEARTVPAATAVAKCAVAAGASGVVFSGQTLRGRMGSFGTEEGRASAEWRAQTHHLTDLGRRCHDLGARLFFHNHDPQFEHDGWEMDSVLAADPSVVELCVDVGHAAQAMPQDRLLAWLRDHWDRVGCLHYKDIDAQRRLVESLGDGVMDFGAVSRLAVERDFAGWIVAELDTGRANPARGVVPVRAPLEDARRSAALIAATLGR